jgi:hypothetical protein
MSVYVQAKDISSKEAAERSLKPLKLSMFHYSIL